MADPSPFENDGHSGGLVAKQGAGDNAAPLSVSEISAMLKRVVEDRFGFVRLRGELSGVKRAASGHLYCALKDDKAVIDAETCGDCGACVDVCPTEAISME